MKMESQTGQKTKPLWRDALAPLEARLEDLLGRLTLEEKIAQLDDQGPAVERLGLPGFRYGGEALHGLCNTGRATSFPMPIGLASTFNDVLVEKIAAATGDEMRAKYHSPLWTDSPRVCLLVFSPVINILRDPRWGRAQETFGEDPFLTGRMGAAYVRGLQGNHPKYLKLAACAKHLGAHSGPETLRSRFNAIVSPRDLRGTYLPAFADLIRAGAATVMATYNRVNGEHCCAHSEMIGKFLRRELGFDGVVLSDGGALGSLHCKKKGESLRMHEHINGELDSDGHNLTADTVETAGLCLREQCDFELGRHAYRLAGEAIARGLISEKEVDRAVRRILRLRFRLGEYDPKEGNPHAHIPTSVIQCQKHLDLARQSARESVVLLKNENDTLPLREARDRVVLVTGPASIDLQVLLGNFYKGTSGRLVSLLEGITATAPEGVTITHSQGCFLTHPNIFDSDWCLGLSEWSDTVVACVGYSPLMEGEQGECIGAPDGGDKSSIALPAHQLQYLRRLRERINTNPRKPRLVVVVTCGSPLELAGVHELADAMLVAWYPGEQGGMGVGDVLWGNSDASGRLPATFPQRLSDLPSYEDYAMAGRTYRYQKTPSLYPFGYGLSYTEFKFKLCRGTVGKTTVSTQFDVSNCGSRDGECVPQIYARWPDHPAAPACALVGFSRVALKAGASATVSVELPVEKLIPLDEQGRLVSGEHRVELAVCRHAPVQAIAGSREEPQWISVEIKH